MTLPASYSGGSFTLTVTAISTEGTSAASTSEPLLVTVLPVDDQPVAVGDAITAAEDTSFSGDVSGNDTPCEWP